MFVTALHFAFLFTLMMIAARTATMHVVRKRPGSSLAKAMSYTYG